MAPAISPGSMSSGRLGGLNDSAAISATVSARLERGAVKSPSAKSTSPAVGAEQMGGDRLGLDHDLLGREMDRRPAEGGRARAAGAFAVRDLVGVALHVMHLVGVDAEAIAQQLLVDRLVALALGDRARHQGHGAAAVEADLGRLEARRPRRARSCWRGRGRAICRARATSARRRSKPAASASFSARSRFFSNSPQS